jgi:hypothetical protein
MNERKPLIGLTLVIGLIVFGELLLGVLWWEK